MATIHHDQVVGCALQRGDHASVIACDDGAEVTFFSDGKPVVMQKAQVVDSYGAIVRTRGGKSSVLGNRNRANGVAVAHQVRRDSSFAPIPRREDHRLSSREKVARVRREPEREDPAFWQGRVGQVCRLLNEGILAKQVQAE